MTAVADMLSSAVDAELEKLKILFDDDLAAFNQLVRNSEVPAITVPQKVTTLSGCGDHDAGARCLLSLISTRPKPISRICTIAQ